MRLEAVPREINFVKVGAVAAFLLAATIIAIVGTFGALSDAVPRVETEEFLDDIVDQRNFTFAVIWLVTFVSLPLVLVFLGLYYGLRRWSEDYMRVAVLVGVIAAIINALALAPATAIAAYIVPAWGEAGDEATRAILLSDAKILLWTSDAMSSMFFVAIAIATILASLVMLRVGGLFWTGLGWIGIVAGVVGIVGVFALAEEGFEIADFISAILTIIWLLGAGVGLLWRLPAEEGTHLA
jgi:MFS family permease